MDLTDKIIMKLPSESGNYKFIQLTLNDIPAFIFSEAKYALHRQILTETLKSNNIPYETTTSLLHEIIPCPVGKNYALIGAGRADIDINRKKMTCFGKSAEFMIEIDEENLELVKQSLKDWDISIDYTRRK